MQRRRRPDAADAARGSGAGGRAALALLWLCLAGRGAAAATGGPAVALLAANRREAPPRHELRPGLPSPEQSSFRFATNQRAAEAKRREAEAAQEAAEAAAGRRKAAEARLVASNNALVVTQAAEAAEVARRVVATDLGSLEAAAEEANRMLRTVPELAERAAARAVADVRAEALQRLQAEVGQVVGSATWMQSGLEERAADAAQAAAVPYQLAKLRTTQTMWLYVTRARELGTAAAQLKAKAMEIAQISVPLQERGDAVHAQQLQLQARDLLDKAAQMEAQAKMLQETAAEVNGELPAYDDAAKAAAAHAAYQVNPSAIDGPVEIPKPPFPLELPDNTLELMSAPAPAPAPAPSSPVAPAPAPAAAP